MKSISLGKYGRYLRYGGGGELVNSLDDLGLAFLPRLPALLHGFPVLLLRLLVLLWVFLFCSGHPRPRRG